MAVVGTEEKIEFIRHLENAVVSEIPGTATFECELSRPNVKVQWMKGNKPILPDHKYDIKMDGAVHRLVIRDVTGSDDISEYSATVRGLTSKASLDLQGETMLLIGISHLRYDARDSTVTGTCSDIPNIYYLSFRRQLDRL